MSGERDLDRLLADLKPELSPQRYCFETTDRPELTGDTFALIREAEGVTAIRESPDGEWARISLGVQSSLQAVGLTAALSNALAERRLSANIVAALHHDHIFVQWERREEALAVIRGISKA